MAAIIRRMCEKSAKLSRQNVAVSTNTMRSNADVARRFEGLQSRRVETMHSPVDYARQQIFVNAQLATTNNLHFGHK